MSSKPILYSCYSGSCPYRVRIALALKNVDYEYKSVEVLKEGGEPGDQLSPEFTKKNPMQQLPVLEIDGEPISQSLAIIEYLEEKYPEPRLLPDDIILRAKVRAITQLIASGIQPLQNVSVIRRVEAGKKLEWSTHFITKGLQALEAVLSKTAGKYCVGDSVTMADICLAPQVNNAIRIRNDMTPFPTIMRIYCALMELPAFKVAHPSRQPNVPDNYGDFTDLEKTRK
ncbi:maleylacetoacetate isomerase-like [Ixodes scapularis]|uniref:maleylacetoacetate isomerase-like n=1 Tax=Ixodes scapularis TaxID=6945 RepID=UPI001A9D10F4|nr:maleylacetoacetate isomerase-like [Ixodes scapularis]